MGIAWIEPWDFYADLPDTAIGAASVWNGGIGSAFDDGFSLVAGLLGGTGLALQVNDNGTVGAKEVYRAIPPTTQVTLNFYARYTIPQAVQQVIQFKSASLVNQCQLQLTPIGVFQVLGEGEAVMATGTFIQQADAVNHFRILVDITTPGDNSFKLYINGNDTPDIDVDGVDLMDDVNLFIEAISIRRSYRDAAIDSAYDHMICLYDECTLIPELEMYPLHPTGDDAAAWTRSAGANNYANIDEAQIDGDATYNHSTTVNQKDRFTYPALGFVPDYIYSVSLVTTARKEESATQTLQQHIKIAATEYPSADIFLSTTYSLYYKHYVQNPATVAPWVPADLPIKTGYELTS